MTTLQAHNTWAFHAEPNSITWSSNQNTKVTDTYGGRVVQLLSVNLGDLNVDFDSGSGGAGYENGREYIKAFARWFREAILWQRDTGNPAIFSHPGRSYVISCYLDSFSMKDSLNNVNFPFSIKGKIQEDLMGTLKKDTYKEALSRLANGVGWHKDEYTWNASAGATSTSAPSGGGGSIAMDFTQ